MAIKAKGQITLSTIIDVQTTNRYYLLQTSTLSTPSKPTTYPPDSSWDDTEPSYTEGSTESLYLVDCTVFCDGTFVYSSVSLSSAYEAAKAAYNKALAAAKVATNYMKHTTEGLVVGNLTESTLGNNVRISSNSVDIRNGNTIYASYGSDYIYLAKTNQNATIDMCAGAAKMYHLNDNVVESRFIIESNYEIDLITQYAIFNDVYFDDGTNSGEAYIRMESHDPSSGTPVPGGLVNIRATTDDASATITMQNGLIDLYADDKIRLSGLVYATNDIILPNDYEIRGINTSGDTMELIGLSSGNNTVVGFGSYSQGIGQTRIYGQGIRMYVGSAGAYYKPYYEAGDSVSGLWWGGGFISSSSKKIYFTIPLAKPVIGDPTITVTNVDGFQVLQDGNYAYGATSSMYVAPSSLTGTLSWDGSAIRVTATMDNATNAVNNAPCGIACNIKIAFS